MSEKRPNNLLQKQPVSGRIDLTALAFTDADLERIERQLTPLLNTVRQMRAQFREQEARSRVQGKTLKK